MKTIPPRLLRDSVTFETYSGEGGYGPVFDAAVTVLGKASMIRQLVRNADGEEAVSEMTVYLAPADAAVATPQSLVTFGTYSSVVLTSGVQARPGESVLVKVTCA